MTTTIQQLNSDRSTAMPDLSGANLSGANFLRSDFSGANLSGANLSGARFSCANLSGARFSCANLSGANLSGANLAGANFFGANLSGANLSGANLAGANFFGADLWNTIGNGKEIVTLQLGEYTVNICGEDMQIGCTRKPITAWEALTMEDIKGLWPGASSAWAEKYYPVIRAYLDSQLAQPDVTL